MPPLRALVIDDEPDMRQIVTVALGHVAGWSVTCAGSCMEALEAGPVALPDVVLLDVNMPEIDGPTTFFILRDEPWGAAVPIIFLTGAASPADEARYAEMGAAGLIPKPFDPLALADRILKLLR